MSRADLNKFHDWVNEKKNREVEITLGGHEKHGEVKIWVYDYEMMIGQYVKDISEIDLFAKEIEYLEQRIEEATDKLKRLRVEGGNE